MNYVTTYAGFLKKFLKPRRPMKAKARRARPIRAKARRAHPIRVVFDCSNGTAGIILKELFRELRTENLELRTFLINDKPDGNFPAHGPDPMKSGAMNDLRKTVKKHKADLGAIFDADGDRVFFMDNRGRSVISDISATLISKNYKSPIILDLRTGYLGRELISADNKKIIDSKVGHYFIKKLMRARKVNFASELSGHYYFHFESENYYADSGIFAAIQFINAVSKLDTDLADWMDSLPKYYQSGEINFSMRNAVCESLSERHMRIKWSANAPMRILKKIEAGYKNHAVEISHLDGLTMRFASPAGEWRFNLRPSNTEDLLRLNLEAKNKGVFKRELAKIKKMFK